MLLYFTLQMSYELHVTRFLMFLYMCECVVEQKAADSSRVKLTRSGSKDVCVCVCKLTPGGEQFFIHCVI